MQIDQMIFSYFISPCHNQLMKEQSIEITPTLIAPPFDRLASLFYFQIFSHPLNFQELCLFNQSSIQDSLSFKLFLEQMVKDRLLFKIDNYYLLENNKEWVLQRIENEERAERYLKKTKKVVHLIRRFPFVEAIFLSGSASKGVVSKGGDIDYFIMTKPGRLWITRTLLVLFKKIILLNSHRYFCINYLVDTNHLEIEEKNRFTATEITTLLPVFQTPHYKTFLESNQWVKNYYPNAKARKSLIPKSIPKSRIKTFLEYLLSGKMGEYLDIWAMQLSIKHWKKKFNTMEDKHFKIALKSRSYVSKHHPQNFQDKVMKRFVKNITTFEKKHDFQFNKE